MSILRRHKSRDVLFLMPVRLNCEKLPQGKVRMLYCDGAGKVYASLVEKAVYELARKNASKLESGRRPFATLGLEVAPGRFLPKTVEVGPEQVWALEHILEHALKHGKLPDILKRYVKPILKLGEAGSEITPLGSPAKKRHARTVATPRVLERLPYYPEKDMEFSVPIYKAEHKYPLVVLKIVTPDRQHQKEGRRLLVLDSDGDLATIKAPDVLIDNLEKVINNCRQPNERETCVVISQQGDGLGVSYMSISQQQRKALDIIVRYFTQTGISRRPVSAAARAVLSRARNHVAFGS